MLFFFPLKTLFQKCPKWDQRFCSRKEPPLININNAEHFLWFLRINLRKVLHVISTITISSSPAKEVMAQDTARFLSKDSQTGQMRKVSDCQPHTYSSRQHQDWNTKGVYVQLALNHAVQWGVSSQSWCSLKLTILSMLQLLLGYIKPQAKLSAALVSSCNVCEGLLLLLRSEQTLEQRTADAALSPCRKQRGNSCQTSSWVQRRQMS